MSLIKKLPPLKAYDRDWIEIDLDAPEVMKEFYSLQPRRDQSFLLNTNIVKIANDIVLNKFGYQIALYGIDMSKVSFDWLFNGDFYTKQLILQVKDMSGGNKKS